MADPIVIKIGGSVLTGRRAYARAARWLAGRVFGSLAEGERPARIEQPLLVVVSAERGETDRLEAEARAIAARPDPRMLDLLWATGELQSAARLALHLQARGVPACALNAHETGLHVDGGMLAVRAGELTRALESHAVVVVPGFLGATARGTIVTLGRGGSDLSAVTLAAALGARHCELIKDVPGYFTADPSIDQGARHLPHIDIDAAIDMAAAGCPLVQAAALHAARAHGVRLLITTTRAEDPHTVVSTPGALHAFCHEDDSRRAAVGA
jgi:aspartate kinase